MDWLKFGSSLGRGVLNLFGGLGDTIATNKNIDKQIKAQQEENRLNREWNLSLAKMQNQWNIEQWQNQKQANSKQKK